MSDEPKHLLHALRLFWAALGPARFYLAGTLGVILLLAAIGLGHLIPPARSIVPPNKAVARIAPGVTAPSPSSILNSPSSRPSPTATAPALERAIAITEVTEAEERGPRGETFIVAKIGMVSQTATEKDKVEIHVAFFDLTPDNQMRPTDAQVTYQWITPVRDWTDPTPKYLAASYLNRRAPRHAPERLRYGGFLVRVYADGKLQDERSQPESLIASLRTNAVPPAGPTSDLRPQTTVTPPVPPSSVSALSRRSPGSRDEGGSPTPTSDLRSPTSGISPTDHSSPVTDHSSESLPKGIPVPGKPGFVSSPYDPKFLIDVRGFPPGTLVIDPNTNKPFRVP